jgi:hypothetical protein
VSGVHHRLNRVGSGLETVVVIADGLRHGCGGCSRCRIAVSASVISRRGISVFSLRWSLAQATAEAFRCPAPTRCERQTTNGMRVYSAATLFSDTRIGARLCHPCHRPAGRVVQRSNHSARPEPGTAIRHERSCSSAFLPRVRRSIRSETERETFHLTAAAAAGEGSGGLPAGMQWHFSPETGSPYWLRRVKALDVDPLTDVKTLEELALFRTLSTSCATCLFGTSRSAWRTVEVNDRARR